MLVSFLLLSVLAPLLAQPGQDSLTEGAAHLKAGRLEQAAEVLRRATEERPEEARGWYLLGMALHSARDFEAALEIHVRAAEFEETRINASYNAACACALLGDPEGAFDWLGQALEAGLRNPQLLANDADLLSIRKDPRFQAMLWAGPVAFVEDVKVHYVLEGEAAGDRFGWIGRNAGDCDGDGIADLLISAPFKAVGGAQAGRIYVHSGKDGRELFRCDGKPGDQLGIGIDSAGDVNGDGRADQLAGASGADQGAGAVFLYSGEDGALLWEAHGEAPGDAFGRKLAGAGDQDGDGVPDVIVGAAGCDGNGNDSGRVYVLSGKDGEILFAIDGARAGERFGSTVDACALDGRRLLVIGAMDAGDDQRGCVYVYRVEDEGPELAFVIDGEDGDVNLGRMFVSVIGDLDGDGVPDVYASDWESNANGLRGSGRVYLHSGKDGSRLHSFAGENPGDGFGIGTAEAGDVDGDGCDDILIGAWQNGDGARGGGKCYLRSGKSGALMATYTCTNAGDTFGFDTTGLGDIDGDGRLEFLITSADSFARGPKSGRVLVLSAPER